MPKRLPYEILILAALALSSCSGDGKALRTHDEIEDIADAAAASALEDSPRLATIESRLDEIEGRLNM